jgi:TonB family protein
MRTEIYKSLSALSLLVGALAPVPATAQERRQPRWQVDWGQYYCTLVRHPDETTPYFVGFRHIPGTLFVNLVMIPDDSDRLPRSLDELVIKPAGTSHSFETRVERRPGQRRMLASGSVPRRLLSELAEANEIELRADGELVQRIPLIETARAVAALRQCRSQVLQEWGVDEEALNALRSHPGTTNNYGLNPTDYPHTALRDDTEGRVIVRMDVSAEGRATGCAPVASSGSRLLDDTTCRIILRRARFSPPIGADGQPTAAQSVNAVTWRIAF